MAYRLVRGNFRLVYQGTTRRVGAQPDGDSLWFFPNNPARLNGIAGRNADLGAGGQAQLRFEGIDALETHYAAHHQQLAPALAARDFVLSDVGFTQVDYANGGQSLSASASVPQSLPGYILTKAIDPFGRRVAFVYGGNPPEADGSQVWIDEARLNASVNARLMARGHVYPGYYTGLPWDLRERLTQLAQNAWFHFRGVWDEGVDVSNTYTRIRNAAVLETLALWPKFFRRMVRYFQDGNTEATGFPGWLRADRGRNDELLVIPEGRATRMDDVFDVSGNRIRMYYWPEELVITPR